LRYKDDVGITKELKKKFNWIQSGFNWAWITLEAFLIHTTQDSYVPDIAGVRAQLFYCILYVL